MELVSPPAAAQMESKEVRRLRQRARFYKGEFKIKVKELGQAVKENKDGASIGESLDRCREAYHEWNEMEIELLRVKRWEEGRAKLLREG